MAGDRARRAAWRGSRSTPSTSRTRRTARSSRRRWPRSARGSPRATAPRVLCGDLNTPRREQPDGTVWSFARDSRGRLREERAGFWDEAELGVVPGLRGARLRRRVPRAARLRRALAELDVPPDRRPRRRLAARPRLRAREELEPVAATLPPRLARRRARATTPRSRSIVTKRSSPPRAVDKDPVRLRTSVPRPASLLPGKGFPMQRAAVLWRASPGTPRRRSVRPHARGRDGRRVGRELQLHVGQRRQRGHRRHPEAHQLQGRHAILNVSAIKPGETKSGTVTLTNTGNIAGDLSVEGVGRRPTRPARTAAAVASRLNVDGHRAAATSASRTGKLAALASAAARHLGRRAQPTSITVHGRAGRRRHRPAPTTTTRARRVGPTFDWETVS